VDFCDFIATLLSVLDIYGFESLEKNSYEQLLINLTNERLQQFFVSKVLDREQQAYEAEGIQWESVPLPDATPTVRVIQ
ncbi:myosin, putative, partial [Perkinsus marinus ATCC 50983]